MHDDQTVGQLHDLRQIGRDQQHRNAGARQLDELFADEFRRADVNAARRLVEEQNVGIQKQDLRQRRALLFAARKIIRMTVKQVGQFAEGNDLCKPLGFAFGFW